MIVGVGLDVVEISRIAVLEEKHGGRFAEKLLTEGELAELRSQKEQYATLAGRFAAKEAALKALGTGFSSGIGWRDVEVVKNAQGAPSLLFHGRAAKVAEDMGVTGKFLSITHDGGVAAAVVVLER